jgi:glycosyltransferase involved in cell wall biosynthesis
LKETKELEQQSGRPIAIFVPDLRCGGAQRFVVNLANELTDLVDCPVHVVVARAQGEFISDLRPGVEVVNLDVRRTALSIFGLMSYFVKFRPLVAMSTLNYANVILLLAGILAGRPCRLVIREANVIVPYKYGRPWERIRRRAIVTLMRYTYWLADVLVVITGDVKKTLGSAGVRFPKKVVEIGNPVVDQRKGATAVGLDWLPSPRPRFICAIGSLSFQKGFDILLDAFARIPSTEIHLVILGEGDRRDALEQQALELGVSHRVHMPGFVSNPMIVLEFADLFVLSSRWEGFVNVLLEALMVGVPVVSTDCPGSPRTVLEDGLHGLLVPVDDSQALSDAIVMTLERPVGTREGRVERAREFSVHSITQEYILRAFEAPARP